MDKDYIVKSRDINIEINHTIKDRLLDEDFRKIKSIELYNTIFIIIILLFKWFVFNEFNIIVDSLLLFIIVFINYNIISKNKWNLKIENKTICINYRKKHYLIKYKDLINIKSTAHSYKKVGIFEREYINENFFTIIFKDNDDIKQINLPYGGGKYNYELDCIKRAFITKEELENKKICDFGFFDIKD